MANLTAVPGLTPVYQLETTDNPIGGPGALANSQAQALLNRSALNANNIATNTANIATNTANIATNTADIATNTADIATNTTDINAMKLAAYVAMTAYYTNYGTTSIPPRARKNNGGTLVWLEGSVTSTAAVAQKEIMDLPAGIPPPNRDMTFLCGLYNGGTPGFIYVQVTAGGVIKLSAVAGATPPSGSGWIIAFDTIHYTV